jgi:hypothetical protein
MKTTVAVLAAILISTIITYLAGSFITWDINPGNWEGDSRTLTVITWFVIAIIAFLVIKAMEDK